ncbi:hypothetical protein BDQ17DRAFT_907644 [Cyathus striatus]|nr:hypothetical protein BDQ17DRAFT_907644 [Cyathus striatus]
MGALAASRALFQLLAIALHSSSCTKYFYSMCCLLFYAERTIPTLPVQEAAGSISGYLRDFTTLHRAPASSRWAIQCFSPICASSYQVTLTIAYRGIKLRRREGLMQDRCNCGWATQTFTAPRSLH